ncbi:MAG: sodium-translocating pyrophosphatase [Propionibacteriaceae bacterium]|nr:sodium-translocating pyrophosphatase [Propionibacteriaceae bacterium]
MTLAGCGIEEQTGGESNLQLPEALRNGEVGIWPLYGGLVICVFGLLFGLWTYSRLKNLPVHTSMHEISELIYTTCKAYLVKQGKFLLMLWVFIAVVIITYFGISGVKPWQIGVIIAFSLIGMAGSFGVAWFGIRINTFANSRTSHAALTGNKWAVHDVPARAGMSVGMVLISLELLLMLIILTFLPIDLAGKCFIGFAIGESLGASALRIAGGIFTKIADVGSDLMKIVFKIDEDDPRNPGTIADCTGDNAGDSIGPSADGFETYGVTGVALITFIMLGVAQVAGVDVALQAVLLVWIFAVRAVMLVASAVSFFVNEAIAKARYGQTDFDFERPLTSLVWITSLVSITLTFLCSAMLLRGEIVNSAHLWWQLSIIVSCGTLAGALIPELVKVFTSTHSAHVKEVVKSSEQGGPSLNILSGIVAGNFAGYWLGISIVALMAISYLVSTWANLDATLGTLDHASSVFAFGLVAFGFLGMGPVTIAVDSYGPVTDNAQSVYELSRIEAIDNIDEELHRDFGFTAKWSKAKAMLEENDGAGNTFKATAKPVLIGTAVVGATTMIFSIILFLAADLAGGTPQNLNQVAALLSPIHAPFLLGLITGGAMIFWFSGASTQAVTTGAYRAVQYIKAHIRLDAHAEVKASAQDSTSVVEICTDYAQKGMWVIFLAIFFATLAFAFIEPFFFIGYLIAIAVVGLFQAIFMANAGGAWDNAKKIVETDLGMKGTELHAATVVGDTVGDPFKDTSSVALNPVIKFTTLFGLLAVELAVALNHSATGALIVHILAGVFFLASAIFVWRSFYTMRIQSVDIDDLDD